MSKGKILLFILWVFLGINFYLPTYGIPIVVGFPFPRLPSYYSDYYSIIEYTVFYKRILAAENFTFSWFYKNTYIWIVIRKGWIKIKMENIEFKFIESNGIKIRLAMVGEGPLVIFCHGWPESWYSYRHQLPEVAAAGYRAVAYDVRGYGESDKPFEIEAYTMKNMTQDVIGIIDALGYETAITIGHDWGGPIALNSAALNPERITATGTLSVPIYGKRSNANFRFVEGNL